MAAPSQTSPNQASKATSTAVATVEKDAAPKTPQETSAAALPPTTERSETMTPSTTTRTPAAAPKPQNEVAVPSKNSPLEEEEELTYQNTQTSNVVCTAKELLKDGHFDEALDTISQEMSRITSLIGNDEQGSMHECMAPLYYLYGTTLLYSIEESTDNVAAIMNHQNEGENDDDEEDEDVDDLQIAWENLETARHITQRILVDNATTCIPEIQMDLSRIHLRLGDLTRANGQHVQAIAEYEICLDMRKALFGLYHDKVSEVLFVLAQAYMMLASEADKEDSELNLTPQQVEEHRGKSIQLHVECSKSFAGQIANLCNASPQEITTVDACSQLGNTKTTGMMNPSQVDLSSACQVITVIRQRVQPLVANDTADANRVHALKELLDEIQETLDEMETSKEGIQQVSHMKVMAKEAADGGGGGDGNVVENADGSTTTIGFGTSTSSVTTASAFATSATSAAAAAASCAPATPMMVIKKKKKRDADERNSDEKPAAVQGDCHAKRAKTSDE
jgi:hypothetical protein